MVTQEDVIELELELEALDGVETLILTFGSRSGVLQDVLGVSMIKIEKNRRREGIGSLVINEIKAFAESHGLIVYLVPSTENYKGLVRWYKSLGFTHNKGQYTDYRFLAGSMLYNLS